MAAYLQCDAEGCDHVHSVADVTEALIGTPCPDCGASLLTEDDFRASAPMFEAMKVLEAMGVAQFAEIGDVSTAEQVLVQVHHHAGATNIKIGGQ